MTSKIKRFATLSVLAAAVATAVPALASAAPTPASISVEPGTNSAVVIIHAPDSLTQNGNCQGPWVHTAQDAKLMDASPLLDLANNPRNWLVGNPASPTAADNPSFESYAYLQPGETKTLTIPFLRDGEYVAGALCQDWDGKVVYTLARTSFTVGAPAVEPGNGTGSLSSPFGS
ncbi:hypothetical protein AC1659_19275 [Rhodococcus erythropolis]|uniref:hypothetical protein n=1 Tax=Rhodococcus TaxID=1827 RepID=UPI00038E5778|nr:MULTISPECIES: hypothetical protein [Rhodococcus]EQM32374.1 hypothetical protein N601_17765 [Rhodococcus erythropolis DN1]MBS2991424.1 hypothetical protein [Rhodococcus erythropolis]NRH34196.1 hypothetical protein [Rhodococcus sp. MS13]